MTTPSTIVREWHETLDKSGIFVLSWPSVSPELNPIEHVWAYLKSGLREKTVTGDNDELFNVLDNVSMESLISTVILSIRKIHL